MQRTIPPQPRTGPLVATHHRPAAHRPLGPSASLLLAFVVLIAPALSIAESAHLAYAPAPPDNPLKGFVPYSADRPGFPHSLEWDYLRWSDVMTGATNFNWGPFERKLDAAASRGHQFIARFYLEWPGRPTGVPSYLLEAGLLLRTWTNTNTQPLPPAVDHTPDYEDPRLRAALTNFIHALGTRYDGDPRLGFLQLGLLGTWGEWHTSPRDQWFASKRVQQEVLDAYQQAFRRTRLLARYPAGPVDPRYADTSQRPFGYHDDSFAWATVHTGRSQESWFFETRLRKAGLLEIWRSQPIGGEVRPEAWDCLFNEPTCAPAGQEFDRCLQATHASWLCYEGLFRAPLQGAVRDRALTAARKLGYEFHVQRVETALHPTSTSLRVTVTVTNTGVAPFYYPWPVELGILNPQGHLATTWKTSWDITTLQPGQPAAIWQDNLPLQPLAPGESQLLLRVSNPLPSGHPLRFANITQDRHRAGWLTLLAIRR